MEAKKFTSILAISLMAFSFNSASADEKKNETSLQPYKVEIKTVTSKVSKRPKAPSRQYIDCLYADENLYITFAIPEGECTMTVTDQETGISLQYLFDTEETAEVYVGSLSSAYIELDTENGHSYEGWIE